MYARELERLVLGTAVLGYVAQLSSAVLGSYGRTSSADSRLGTLRRTLWNRSSSPVRSEIRRSGGD
jgi:hypothetical protein